MAEPPKNSILEVAAKLAEWTAAIEPIKPAGLPRKI